MRRRKSNVKGVYSSFWETRRRATERHLPYGITQCYVSPDTGERAPPGRPVLDLLTLEGWKAKLTMVLVIYLDGLPVITLPAGWADAQR